MKTLALVLALWLLLFLFGAVYEARTWNHGVCLACGTDWLFVDRDSQGGRLYRCGCGLHEWWASYPWVRKGAR